MKFQKQKGVALVVGLVMLLVLTIMGISSMSNTTQELKIACNFQTHNDAFMGAASCVDSAIDQVDRNAAFPQEFECVLADFNAVVKSTVDYVGCQVVEGSSLRIGAYENVYDIDSSAVATGCGGEAFSHIVQAIGIKTAKPCAE